MKKQVMPIGLAHRLYNPEKRKKEICPVLGTKKGLTDFGEAFEMKLLNASLESQQAFGIELIYVVIGSRIYGSMTILKT